MPRVGGKPFHCPCGCNVFVRRGDIYTCNACSAEYQGERAAAGSPPPTPDDHGVRLFHGPDCEPCQQVRRMLTGQSKAALIDEVKRLKDRCAVLAGNLDPSDVRAGWAKATAELAELRAAGPPPTNGPTRQQIQEALTAGWHACPKTAPSTLDGMTDAVLSLLASHRPDSDPERRS